jgi:Glycine rich protein
MQLACTYALGVGTCYDTSTSTAAAGYYCPISGIKECTKCQSGYYGSNGRTCEICGLGTTSVSGSTDPQSCKLQLNFFNNGSEIVYVPFGIEKVHVKMWGGGGGGDTCKSDYIAASGGGGGYASCNITVKQNSNLYVIVGGGGETNDNVQSQNLGGSPVPIFSLEKIQSPIIALLSLYYRVNYTLFNRCQV